MMKNAIITVLVLIILVLVTIIGVWTHKPEINIYERSSDPSHWETNAVQDAVEEFLEKQTITWQKYWNTEEYVVEITDMWVSFNYDILRPGRESRSVER